MIDSKQLQIKPSFVAKVLLDLTVLWCVSAGIILHHGLGKQLKHFTLFWNLVFFFFPFLCAAVAALLVYGYFRRVESRSVLILAAIILGFVPLVGFGIFVITAFLRDIFSGS